MRIHQGTIFIEKILACLLLEQFWNRDLTKTCVKAQKKDDRERRFGEVHGIVSGEDSVGDV